MAFCLLPFEILMIISEHLVQQSALDLLSFARTSSSLRKAARLIGRREISKDAILPSPGRHFIPEEEQCRCSRFLQTAVQEMEELDFPVRGIPGNGRGQLPNLPRCFWAKKHTPNPRESPYEYTSSLLIRDMCPLSVELFDILEHPPKLIEVTFSKPIPWLPFSDRSTRTCNEDLLPCLQLQAISWERSESFLRRRTWSAHSISSTAMAALSWRIPWDRCRRWLPK